MVRLMQEGEEGRLVRNALVEAMWEDVDFKSKQLGVFLKHTTFVYLFKFFFLLTGTCFQCTQETNSGASE